MTRFLYISEPQPNTTQQVDTGIDQNTVIAEFQNSSDGDFTIRRRRIILPTTAAARIFVATGYVKPIDFSNHDYIYTTGLSHCFAICAVWEKNLTLFAKGLLSHISNPNSGAIAAFAAELGKLNALARDDLWIVVCMLDANGWPDNVIQKLFAAGIPRNKLSIYYRIHQLSNFGIDKFGRFGEIDVPPIEKEGLDPKDLGKKIGGDKTTPNRGQGFIGNRSATKD